MENFVVHNVPELEHIFYVLSHNESEKTVSGPICSRIVALYHQNSHNMTKSNLSLFQFHNGSIKGKNRGTFMGLCDLFQFHNGSIKGR